MAISKKETLPPQMQGLSSPTISPILLSVIVIFGASFFEE